VTVSALALALALAGSPAAPQVLAQVDAVQITRADLEERLRVLRVRKVPADPAGQVAALVDEALLAGEARRRGLDKDPTVTGLLAQERRRMAVDAFAASLVAEPSEADLRSLYHQTGDSVRLVLVKLETEADARAALQRVKAGGDIAAEARRSLDPRLAAAGGDTGQTTRAAVAPALAGEAFSAPIGSVFGPVQLELGWAIAKVVERTIADEAGFAARREAIAAFARDQMRSQVRTHLVEQLRRKAKASVDEAFLAKVGRPPSASDLDHAAATVNGKPIPYRDLVKYETGIPGGHGASAARSAFAWREVDRIVLETEALAKGFDRSPAVARTLPGIERNLLASAASERIAGRADASTADPKVREALEQQRAKAKIRIDKAAVAAAERELR
jgi:parvulin-like peptidyl-prolyl isomerase